ncbi:MAG TPA: heavy metal translocating P-type ATPase [Bacilli bacterium]|nr:heavy metal translocating P-type ATPase [Bacilli bacterium]
MIRFIFKHKNKLMITSLLLIISGFIALYGFKHELVFNITFITASIIGVIPIALQAYQALRVKVVSIDVLVTIAVIGAFVIKSYEESAIVTFLFLFGAYLEQRTLQKTRNAIKELTEMAPEKATIINADGSTTEIDIEDVEIGDLLIVKTGGKIPVDGVVISGEGYVNEATITGESFAQIKTQGKAVYAGTILENGTIQIKTNQVGEDTVFGKIIELVEEAQDSKSKAERFIDTFSKYYTPAVLVFGFIVWLITRDVAMAVTILVLGCPGALVIGIPVSNVAGIGNGARNGILIKGSEVIKDFSKVDTIVFDKTGTLTTGNTSVTDVKYFENDETKANNYLVAVEKESNHPLAQAIVSYIKPNDAVNVTTTNVVKGEGIIAEINNEKVYVGNKKLIENNQITLSKAMIKTINEYETLGNSLVILAIERKVYMILGIRDELRPGLEKQLRELRKDGVKQLILLSGDNQGSVNVVKEQLHLDVAIGEMLPKHKRDYIKTLQEQGNIVAFVGDGINDSPSLATAEIGIAMGSGTDVAIETSNVVLMSDDFAKIAHARKLTKKIIWNMRQNIIIALAVVAILITSLLTAEWMNMAIGMLVHEGSILVVILNGMRLLRFKRRN